MYPYKIDYDVGKQVELKLNQENKRSRENCMSNPSAYNYTVDITQSHSINWIHSIYQDKNPFFLYMSFTVHMQVVGEVVQKIQSKARLFHQIYNMQMKIHGQMLRKIMPLL